MTLRCQMWLPTPEPLSSAVQPEQCSREARYIDTAGELRCSLCDMASTATSIRLGDIPELLQALERLIHDPVASKADEETIKRLLWRSNLVIARPENLEDLL
jgi:alkylhydroperoxidase family enzyme